METIQEEDYSLGDTTQDVTCSTCLDHTSCQHDTTNNTSFTTPGLNLFEKDIFGLLSYRSLFRYANHWDIIMMIGGLLLAIGHGK
jgi:hypothetical protein